MSRRGDTRPDFEEFVVVCSDGLLRTAYLLTRDPSLAEDLLQTALTKAWFAWTRLDEQPEPYARTTLATTYATWWRRRWRGERPTRDLEPRQATGTERETHHDLWAALGRLTRRQRAVVVLRFYDDLAEADTAEVLSCSVGTVSSQTATALARLRVDPRRAAHRRTHPGGDLGVDDLRDVLRREAEALGGTEPLGAQARLSAVAGRVRSGATRRHAAAWAALVAAAVAAVTGFVVAPTLLPDPAPRPFVPQEPMVQAPPRLAGFRMPPKLRVRSVGYSYFRGEQVDQDRQILRVAVAATPGRQVIGWATSPGTPGQVVVSVDGTVADRSRAGAFAYGVRLTPRQTHLVVVRVTRPQPGKSIGLAIYGPETF
ncbi:MAG TPA: SigE family RNA polymerase sigma factor [Nocardioidaceae bacterium]|nr:SigE family RNA polymerase sigma factor [Nocardioidaceae bacterium]